MHTHAMARSQEVVDARGAVVRRVPRVGDLRWDGQVWQRWSGRRWTRALYSVRPERLTNPATFAGEEAVTRERRAKALALAVDDQVAAHGADVVHEGPSGVVLGYRRPVSMTSNALLTLVTVGLWAPFWLASIARRREDRVRLEADRWGNVWGTSVTGG